MTVSQMPVSQISVSQLSVGQMLSVKYTSANGLSVKCCRTNVTYTNCLSVKYCLSIISRSMVCRSNAGQLSFGKLSVSQMLLGQK
jgi:hypothetical protein